MCIGMTLSRRFDGLDRCRYVQKSKKRPLSSTIADVRLSVFHGYCTAYKTSGKQGRAFAQLNAMRWRRFAA
jgi:hypothetical protein